jgi:ubiquinone/menaquinone biosynthesis C-methylase UbiE
MVEDPDLLAVIWEGGTSKMNHGRPLAEAKARFYDGIALEFDVLMNPLDLERRKDAVFTRMLAGTSLNGVRTLDVGCGTGEFSLVAQALGAQVVSVDIGAALLKVARAKGLRSPVQADALSLPFADHEFGLVISSECIEHTPDGNQAIREMLRVLRPGGRLAITCPNRSWRWVIVLATRLGLRPFGGVEEPPSWAQLSRWVEAADGEILQHFGLNAVPFQLPFARRYLPHLDSLLSGSERRFINQCLLAIKRHPDKRTPEVE